MSDKLYDNAKLNVCCVCGRKPDILSSYQKDWYGKTVTVYRLDDECRLYYGRDLAELIALWNNDNPEVNSERKTESV